MKIDIKTNFEEYAQRIKDLGRQAQFGTAVALTRTAQDVKPAIRAEMSRAFDRPTTYTLDSLFVKAATRDNLEARVWLKDSWGKGTPAEKYLGPQVFGGGRAQKGMERMLQAARMMQANHFAVPASGAQLDSNGNVKRSQIVQILSQLQLQRGAGYESRANRSGSRSRRTIARQGVTYFAIAVATRGLQPGVYMKRKFAIGSAVRPVFLFAARAQYRPLLKFFEVGEATARERFPVHFDAELAKAIQSARLA